MQESTGWNMELFQRCSGAHAEVRILSEVYCGQVVFLGTGPNDESEKLILKLRSVSKKQTLQSREIVLSECELRLRGCGLPRIIDQGQDDCMYFQTEDGYVAIFFNEPQINRSIN